MAGQMESIATVQPVNENAIQYNEALLNGTVSHGFCSCSKMSAATRFLIGTSMMTNMSRTQLYKYRVKEAEYPFVAALGTKNTLPASGAKEISRFAFGVGMHQRIATV